MPNSAPARPSLNEGGAEKFVECLPAEALSQAGAKSLLEIAKRGVEIAIEKDEQEAQKWIKSELDKFKIKF